MAFAVLQTNAEPLAPQQLREAYRGVPGIPAVDADRLSQDAAPGILARGLSGGQASALQAGLAAHNVPSETVDETTLPVLPPAKTLRRLEFTPEALVIYDPLNRQIPVDWRHIGLIAAGSVHQASFDRKRNEVVNERIEFRGMLPVKVREVKVTYATQESQGKSWQAELLLSGGAARFNIEAANFQYICLGNRVTRDVATDFRLLLQELRSHAPGAALNRGAQGLLAEPPLAVSYTRTRALEEEMMWWLWNVRRGEAA